MYFSVEEYQNVNISIEEHNDLMDALSEMLNIPEKQLQEHSNWSENYITPIKETKEHVTFPNNINSSQDVLESTFDQNVMQTGAQQKENHSISQYSNNIDTENQELSQRQVDLVNNTSIPTNETIPRYEYAHKQSLDAFDTSNQIRNYVNPVTKNSSSGQTNIQSYTSIVLNVPTEVITKTVMSSTPMLSSFSDGSYQHSMDCLNRQIQDGPMPKKKIGCRSKKNRYKNASFVELENFDPNIFTSPEVCAFLQN